MAEKTKLILSEPELLIAQDTQWILTKSAIIQKLYIFFNARMPFIKKIMDKQIVFLSPEINSSVPKIFKGENYLQFPYVIMDYPAVFQKENIFALRTMFWWGNFFSVTLHLSGVYKKKYGSKILKQLQTTPQQFYVCMNENEWQHHFEADNYLAANEISNINIGEIIKKPFIKVALKYNLQQWNNMHQLIDEAYEKIFCLLEN